MKIWKFRKFRFQIIKQKRTVSTKKTKLEKFTSWNLGFAPDLKSKHPTWNSSQSSHQAHPSSPSSLKSQQSAQSSRTLLTISILKNSSQLGLSTLLWSILRTPRVHPRNPDLWITQFRSLKKATELKEQKGKYGDNNNGIFRVRHSFQSLYLFVRNLYWLLTISQVQARRKTKEHPRHCFKVRFWQISGISTWKDGILTFHRLFRFHHRYCSYLFLHKFIRVGLGRHLDRQMGVWWEVRSLQDTFVLWDPDFSGTGGKCA